MINKRLCFAPIFNNRSDNFELFVFLIVVKDEIVVFVFGYSFPDRIFGGPGTFHDNAQAAVSV